MDESSLATDSRPLVFMGQAGVCYATLGKNQWTIFFSTARFLKGVGSGF